MHILECISPCHIPVAGGLKFKKMSDNKGHIQQGSESRHLKVLPFRIYPFVISTRISS